MAKRTVGANTECICGHEIKLEIKRPKLTEPEITKVTCVCGSRYLISAMRDKSDWSRVHVQADIIELSDIASECAKTIIRERMEKEA